MDLFIHKEASAYSSPTPAYYLKLVSVFGETNVMDLKCLPFYFFGEWLWNRRLVGDRAGRPIRDNSNRTAQRTGTTDKTWVGRDSSSRLPAIYFGECSLIGRRNSRHPGFLYFACLCNWGFDVLSTHQTPSFFDPSLGRGLAGGHLGKSFRRKWVF